MAMFFRTFASSEVKWAGGSRTFQRQGSRVPNWALRSGETWGPAQSTGIQGQTLTPVPLGGDRLLALYNRRYGQQAIVMSLVTFDNQDWTTHYEGILYDPRSARIRDKHTQSGLDELETFAFGFPTAIRLASGDILATFWAKERGVFGVNWVKLRVDW